MTHADAFGLVLAAAQVRLEQWRAVAHSENPTEIIDELHECAAEPGLMEAREMERSLAEAIDLVAGLEIRTESLSWLRVEGEL